VRELLVIEDDPKEQTSIAALISASDIHISMRRQAPKALQLLRSRKFDCVILDLKLARHIRVRAAHGNPAR